MNYFWKIISLIMLTLMVPALVCCYGGDQCNLEVCCSEKNHEHQDHERGEHHSPTLCPGKTLSHSQVPDQVILPPMQLFELVELIQALSRRQDDDSACTEPSGPPKTAAPPEFRATWHFTRRAALLARAPAMVA